MKLFHVLFFTVLLLTANVPPASAADQSVGEDLPPKVKGLLLEEMNAILAASQTILDALTRGRDETVAKEARAIHDSFIMKQKMTPEDKKGLLAAVPEAFVERDKAFHQLSADLAEAAREGDKSRQQKLFNRMVAACTECHAEHAVDRFPGLADY